MADRLKAWGPATGWAVVLFFLSAIPDLGVGRSLPISDKLVNFGLYAVLGATFAWGRWVAPGAARHVLLIAVGAIYGLLDEWHQLYVPGRAFDWLDWGADVVGVVVGYGTTHLLLGRNTNVTESK